MKARIASLVKEGYFPPKPDYVRQDVYIHSLVRLLQTAELTTILESKPIRDDWGNVKDWKETTRYDSHGREKAEKMLESARRAVDCIKEYW